MENVSITVKAKQVGNSIAIFVPASLCDQLGISPNTEVVANIHKKKKGDMDSLVSLFGKLKGKKITWNCTEDRTNVWGE